MQSTSVGWMIPAPYGTGSAFPSPGQGHTAKIWLLPGLDILAGIAETLSTLFAGLPNNTLDDFERGVVSMKNCNFVNHQLTSMNRRG